MLIVRSKCAYLAKNGSLRGFDDPGVKLVKPLNFDILEWRKNPEQVLKKVIAENDGFVIPKVISNVAEQVGVEKTAELSGLSVVNVNKSIYLAKAQKELEPYPDPYKTPPAFKMDIRGLFEYAQKRGVEIKDLPYVEVLDFIG